MKHSILHTSDSHLRVSQYGRSERGLDFQRSFLQVIDIAAREKVAAILHAGDLLDSNRPSPAIIKFLFEVNAKLRHEKIPMFVAFGDHDKTDPHWAALLDADRDPLAYHEGGIFALQNQLVTIPGTDLTVYGQDFIGKTKERFLEVNADWPAASILLWHTQVQEFCGFPVETVVKMEELPLSKYALIALGDLHVSKYDQDPASGCWVGYPGSGELCKSDEPLQKTVSIFEFENGRVSHMELKELKTRVVRVYRINTEADLTSVLNEVSTLADQAPMIFGRYNAGIAGVLGRFYATIDPDKAIIRLLPIPESVSPETQKDRAADIKLQDLLPEFLTPGTAIYDVGEACLRPDAPVNELLTAYIDKKLA